MIDPRIGEQLELFPETKPEVEEKEAPSLSEDEVEMIENLRWVIDHIKSAHIEGGEFDEFGYCDAERLAVHKSWLLQRLRLDLGIPEYIAREQVIPLYNVPRADEEYLLEHLLESFNPTLFAKYMKAKAEMMGGDAP